MTIEEKMKKAEKDLERMIQEAQVSSELTGGELIEQFKKGRDAYLKISSRIFNVTRQVGGHRGEKWFEWQRKKLDKLARAIISKVINN